MYEKWVKRLLDILLSTILIIIFAPIMLIIVIIIRRDGGRALFIQERSGKDNIIFKIYKFRTMHIDNDVYDLKNSDRMTKYGNFLKNTSLDELPQLFNILKGDMSFIGPRPWIIDYSKYYNTYQMQRLRVRPGLTGLAQCHGRNNINIKEKIDYDIEYVRNITFVNDLKIICLTIKSILKRDGITTDKFTIKSEIDILKNQARMRGKTTSIFDAIVPISKRRF